MWVSPLGSLDNEITLHLTCILLVCNTYTVCVYVMCEVRVELVT